MNSSAPDYLVVSSNAIRFCVFALRLLSCDFVDRVLALQRRTIHEITRKRTKNKNTKIEELVSALAADV